MSSNPYRILLIDDSAVFRRQVGGALEASGLNVVECGDGAEAMWRARSEGVYDLVLVDIHMPNLDGFSFIREVRKLPGYMDVPIIIVTSDGSRERRLEGRRSGATAWLLKPPDLPGLINSVHAALMRIIKIDGPSPSAKLGSQQPSTYSPELSALSRPPRAKAPAPRSEQAPARSQRSAVLPLAAPSLEPRPRSLEPRSHAPEPRSLSFAAGPASSEPRSQSFEPRASTEPRSQSFGPRSQRVEPQRAPASTRHPPVELRAPAAEPRSAPAEPRAKAPVPRAQPLERPERLAHSTAPPRSQLLKPRPEIVEPRKDPKGPGVRSDE